ncbi:MAG: glycosyltransferase [Ignavibacteria bacterium]
MKILAVLMQYDYGVKERGYSFEYYNIYLPLTEVYKKENVLLFDFKTIYNEHGKTELNKQLIEYVSMEKPDITIFCLFEHEIEPDTVRKAGERTTTVSYFIDDPWRQSFARFWIPCFDYFSTPDYYMYRQYLSEGIRNVIYSPFGFNKDIYKKKDLPKKYDVSFVGGFSPLRKWTISLLEKEGVKVNVFGRGWGQKNNFISQDEMVDIFNQSKINLNLSNGISYDMKFLLYSVRSLRAVKEILLLKKSREQVKGRHYEINGCGGFQLSYFVPGLNCAYKIEEEIAVFDNVYNLAGQIKFFIKNDRLRQSIAGAGYIRSLKEHTSQNYLQNLIGKIENERNVKKHQ